MKSTILVAGIGLLVLFASGCDKLRSRDALNHGVQAYKGAHYTEAVDYFSEVLTVVNLALRVVPIPLTAAIIARLMPAAIKPYSIAVAAVSSAQNLARIFFTVPPGINRRSFGVRRRDLGTNKLKSDELA